MTIFVKRQITRGLNWGLKNISSPHQRFILGATALGTQPFIDYFNKDVDEQTRKFSVARTVVKILVGTTVGVLIRASARKIAGRLIDQKIIKPKYSEHFHIKDKRNAFKDSLGDILGLGACLFTNFAIDAPLTKMGLDFAVEKYNLQKTEPKSGVDTNA